MTQDRHRKPNKRRLKKRRQRRLVLAGFFVVCAALTVGIIQLILYCLVSTYPEDQILDNIYIGNVNVGGMTEKEAEAALDRQLAADRALTVSVEVGDARADALLEEYRVAYEDIRQLTADAVNYGKKGSPFGRYRKIRQLSKKKAVIETQFTIDKDAGKAILLERAVPLADHARNAEISKTSSGFEITEGTEGETVDTEASLSRIQEHLNAGWNHEPFSVQAEMMVEKPSVTAEDLESIQDELGTFATNAGGGDRWKNLKNGVEKLNGTVLMPGEEVSVHDVTAPYDEEHGYVPAGSYENGQVVDTYGGGICQVSSTLYNAVLYAELEVVERYPHSMQVAYVPPSRDAAIAGDVKDFVFKNSYETPVYIYGEIDSANQLRFTIYGKETRQEGRSVEFETEIVSTEEPKTTYEADPQSELGVMKTKSGAHTGKVVNLWKIVRVGGKEVSREVVNNSTYRKTDKVIAVGTKTENAAAANLMKQAIQSQDVNQINAAAAQAKSMGQNTAQGQNAAKGQNTAQAQNAAQGQNAV